MILNEMFLNVSANFETLPYYKEVISAFNTVIRRINAEMELPDNHVDISKDGADDWEDWTDANWEAQTTDDWDSLLRFSTGYTWDNDNYTLGLPTSVLKVKKVYINDIEFERIAYDDLKASDTDEYVFAQVGSELFFTYDLSATTDEVELLCQMKYPLIADGATEYSDMKDNFQAILESGAVYMLSVKPRYKNMDMANTYKEMYERQFANLTTQIQNEEVRLHLTPNYTY